MAATFFKSLSELGLPLSSSPIVWNVAVRGARSWRVVSTSSVGSSTMNGSVIFCLLWQLITINADADGSRYGARIRSGGPGWDERGEAARAAASSHDQQIVRCMNIVVGGFGIFGVNKLVAETGNTFESVERTRCLLPHGLAYLRLCPALLLKDGDMFRAKHQYPVAAQINGPHQGIGNREDKPLARATHLAIDVMWSFTREDCYRAE